MQKLEKFIWGRDGVDGDPRFGSRARESGEPVSSDAGRSLEGTGQGYWSDVSESLPAVAITSPQVEKNGSQASFQPPRKVLSSRSRSDSESPGFLRDGFTGPFTPVPSEVFCEGRRFEGRGFEATLGLPKGSVPDSSDVAVVTPLFERRAAAACCSSSAMARCCASTVAAFRWSRLLAVSPGEGLGPLV